MKAILEIRAGEGGNDSKLFIQEMLQMYQRYCRKNQIVTEVVSNGDSQIVLEVKGEIGSLLKWEGGVHRVQRVPPTEHRGRRQSSTMTVAILPIVETGSMVLDFREVEIQLYRGTGPGGQHKNKTETGVRARHIPTGLTVCICRREQARNKQSALEILAAKIKELKNSEAREKERDLRRGQIGVAGREEKIRTYNFIENRVNDDRLPKPLYCLDRIMDGHLELIYQKIGR